MECKDPEAIYKELAKLGVNVNGIKSMHPTQRALEELLEGILKICGKKLRLEKDEEGIKTIEAHDHIFAIYPDIYSKFDDAFEFLKDGLERNETVMLITDDMTKNDVLKRMSREWNVNAYELEERGDIIITKTKAWYFPTGTVDSGTVIEKWHLFAKNAESQGKAGLRLFADTSTFFKYGLSKQLVEYEAMLNSKFDIPLIAICCYSEDDVKSLTSQQIHMLHSCHKAPASV